MNPLMLSANQPIVLSDGSEHDFVAATGNTVVLRHRSLGTQSEHNIATLSESLANHPLRTMLKAPRQINEVTDQLRIKSIVLADHIAELFGVPIPGTQKLRRRYDQRLPMNELVRRKSEELKKLNEKNQLEARRLGKRPPTKLPTSRSALYELKSRYLESGRAALVDQRASSPRGPFGRADADYVAALTAAIAQTTNASTGTKGAVFATVSTALTAKFGKEIAEQKIPSLSSFYRHFDAVSEGRYTTGSAKNRRSVAGRPDRTFVKRMEVLPGGEVQIDSTLMDVLVSIPAPTKDDPDARETARPVLTAMIDRTTRCILAWTMRLTAAKAVDHVALMAQALTWPLNRPDLEGFRRIVQRNNPDVELLPIDELRMLQAQAPYIVPRRIMMDNGKDFLAEDFLQVLEMFHIDRMESASYTGSDKGMVETTFGSINTLFTQYLDGYVGRSPEHRGYKVEEHHLLSFWAVHQLFGDFLLKVWNHRKHDGLRDPLHPRVTRTPVEMYLACKQVSEGLQFTLTREDYIRMLPTSWNKIHPTGIRHGRREYDSVGLHPWRGKKSSHARRKGSWPVKYDPYNPTAVWVIVDGGTIIECPLREASASLYPHIEERLMFAPADERAATALIDSLASGVDIHVLGELPPEAGQREADDRDAPDLHDYYSEYDDDEFAAIL